MQQPALDAPACPSPGARDAILLRASRHPLASLAAEGLAKAGVSVTGRVLVLVSGGADSTSLLTLLAAIAARGRAPDRALAALAIDHGLRTESADEAASAIAFARHLGVEDARVVRVEVARDGNLLDRAREARLEAAARVARETGADCIALGHHADDLAESILLALGRGGGIDALRPLRHGRELRRADGASLRLVRPLLAARRAELRSFLEELSIPWREDPSNALRTRGALRASPELSPLCDRIAAGALDLLDEADALCRLRDALVDAHLPPGAMRLSRASFDQLPEAARREALVRLAHAAGVELPRPILRAAIERRADADRRPARFRLAAEVELVIDAREVSIEAPLSRAVPEHANDQVE